MLQIMRSRKAESKPLSFSTTMRNPNRIVSFLNCLLPYENKILTHDVIMKVVHNAIKEKLYTPVIVNRTPDLAYILKNDDEKYSDIQIDFIIEMSPQKHKEAGFEYGWDSRFDTIFKLPMEFGFVQYAMGEPIRISTTGHMLIDALNEEESNEEKIQMVFLNSMMKYQSNNPYRKNANSNVPLILLLQVLKMLKEDTEENGAGVFRKMRTTGIISLRGNGRFIDYNAWEIEKIDYILENYSEYKSFESKDEYFDYIGAIDTTVISMENAVPADTTDLRRATLKRFASEYSKEVIYSELHKVCTKTASTDYMLKLLPGPVRLEFLTSIAMVQNFENLDVTPNYTIDDEGLPTNTASGGKADIVCFDKEYQSLVEVTLMCGRQDQVNNEIVPIRRHLLEEKKNQENTFSVFVAPTIHEDTKQIAGWYKFKEGLDIVTYAIDEFVDKIKKEDNISNLLG